MCRQTTLMITIKDEDALTIAYMYGVRDGSKHIKLLEQRIIDLQGHDDLSYIDKKLSKQESEWVGLTDDEVEEVFSFPFHYRSFYKAVEAKLKEKNTMEGE